MKNRLLPQIGSRFYIMGILNLTADSFSGDGLLQQTDPRGGVGTSEAVCR